MHPSGNTLSKERALTFDEERLFELQAELVKLRKKVESDQRKIDRYRKNVLDETRSFHQEEEALRASIRPTYEKFLATIVRALKEKKFTNREKERFYSFALDKADFFPEVPLPPELCKQDDEIDADFIRTFFGDEDEYKQEATRERQLWNGDAPTQPREEEAEDLKRIYHRVAGAVHPDRGKDASDIEQRTALMKELNAAYHRLDVLQIMKIEQQVLHQQERHLSINTFQRSVEEECIRTERDIALLEEQLRQCRSKLRELKQTVVGQFHAERTKLQKQGIDLLQFRSDQLHYLHDHLKDVTDKVLDVLEGRLRKKMFNAYFAQYVEDAELSEEELFTLFDDLMSEYTEQVQSKHRSKGNFTAPRGKRKR